MLSLIPRRMRGEDYSITGGDALRAYARQPLERERFSARQRTIREAMTRPTTAGAEPSRVRDVSRMLEPSRASERFRATRYPEGEVSGLPMVINTPKGAAACRGFRPHSSS